MSRSENFGFENDGIPGPYKKFTATQTQSEEIERKRPYTDKEFSVLRIAP